MTRRSQRRGHVGKPYAEVLRQIKADFERHRQFVVEGLRSVARATSDAQSVKWDMLAEMLQGDGGGTGHHDMYR
jgi:gamma-tubulin complex component 5